MPLSYNTAVIKRDSSRPDGTAGIMTLRNKYGDGLTLHTLELLSNGNKTSSSSIPAGAYQCDFTMSNTFGRKLYIVNSVDGRSGIRFHRGNWAYLAGKHDVTGCILVGMGSSYDSDKGIIMVTSSTTAEKELEKFFKGESFVLVIEDNV